MSKPPEVETLERVRRIETRLTAALLKLGVDTPAQKPTFDEEARRMTVPSPHTSVKVILDSLPPVWHAPFEVCCGNELLFVMRRGAALRG